MLVSYAQPSAVPTTEYTHARPPLNQLETAPGWVDHPRVQDDGRSQSRALVLPRLPDTGVGLFSAIRLAFSRFVTA